MNDRQLHPHELISAMLDGEIDARERAVVEAHLRECPECRDLAGDLTALGEVLADDPVPPVPAGLAERIGWSLRSQGASRRRLGGVRWSGPRTLAALGGVAAAGILAVLVVREGRAPFLDRSPLPPAASSASSEMKPSAEKRDRDETQGKLKSLGYAGTDGTSRAFGTRGNLGAARADAGTVQPPPQAGSPGSGMGATKRDFNNYAPSPADTAASGPLGGVSPVQMAPLAPYPEKQQEQVRPAPSKPENGMTSSTGTLAAGAPALQERAKKTGVSASSAPADKRELAKGPVADSAEGDIAMEEAGAGGTAPLAKDAPTADKEAAGKESGAGAAGPRGTVREREVATVMPPPAAPQPPPAPDAHAAREQAPALRAEKPKVIDNDSLARLAIPACPGSEGAKPAKRWAATSAPLLLRMTLPDAEPDLSALAARLGGSICVERAAGTPPLIVLDAPAGRWSELREALAARAETPGSLTPPPAEGFNVVRVVLRPR